MKIQRSIIAALIMSAAAASYAQQTVFNVPSADVLGRGKFYAELDAAFKVNDQSAQRRFSSFVPRFVAGVGSNVEVGINLAGNIQPGTDRTTLVGTLKWKFYESKRVSLFAGGHVYLPVRNRTFRVGSYTYAAAAVTIGRTRLTAGGFVFTKDVVAPNAARAGGQFAIEQAVGKKLTIAADWMTGRHANGYLTPGVIYKPRPEVTVYLGYSVGNADAARGNSFALFELGYSF